MRIAFYAPLKSPDHPVPSGDRLMAAMLMTALRRCGHDVEIASELRSYSAASTAGAHDEVRLAAAAEIARISAEWSSGAVPDVWFCYHPYSKAPDLLGPALATRFGLAYVTVEASYSERRNIGAWAESQVLVAEAVRQAAVNICLRRKDRDGLVTIAPDARFELLEPFIDVAAYRQLGPPSDARRIVTVAMMRPGDKLESYGLLAAALDRIEHLEWTIAIVGDGPCRQEVVSQFATQTLPGSTGSANGSRPKCRNSMRAGRSTPGRASARPMVLPISRRRRQACLSWRRTSRACPASCATAAPGILTPPGDAAAFADAIARLLDDAALRRSMSQAARSFVLEERSLEMAAARLGSILHGVEAMRNG